MKKIERESAGTKVYYEKLLTELIGKIELSETMQGFPSRFSLEEQGNITCGRAAIIKAVLMKNYNWKKGEKFMGLNEDCKETAYVLGRLFAVLEFIQREANPGINATIRDRYFNSACATPASVFPILIKLKNSHMKKIERESAGTKVYYEKLLTELIGKIELSDNMQGFPSRLSLEEQGKFMLGYYHQVQKRYEKKEEK